MLRQELAEVRAGGEVAEWELQPKIAGISHKRRFNGERRCEMRDVCAKYIAGKSIAVQRHGLTTDTVLKIDNEFCSGAADEELGTVSAAALYCPNSRFVTHHQMAQHADDEARHITAM